MIRTMTREAMASATANFGLSVFENSGFAEAAREAIKKTRVREKRRCPLRSIVVVWLVVVMSLFRDRSLPGVLKLLVNWLRQRRCRWLPLRAVTAEALCHARERVGWQVMRELYQALAARIDPPPSFRKLRVWGADGVQMSLFDSHSNESEFGRPKASRGITAFPALQVIALVSTWTRQIRDVVVQACQGAERPAVDQFLEHLNGGDVLLMDRGFHAVWLFLKFLQKGVHFVCRASECYKPIVLRRLGKGDSIVMLQAYVACSAEEASRPDYKRRRKPVELRMIEYSIGKGEVVRILTDLLDPIMYPARDLALLYHERWECELVYDEVKTHLAAVSGGTVRLPLRSKTANGVYQELYGLLIGYNLVRDLIAKAAQVHDIPPVEISFVGALDVIRDSTADFQRATRRQRARLVRQLFADIASCRLRRPRRPKWYPRVVRIKITRFARKQPHHKSKTIHYAASLRLVAERHPLRRAA